MYHSPRAYFAIVTIFSLLIVLAGSNLMVDIQIDSINGFYMPVDFSGRDWDQRVIGCLGLVWPTGIAFLTWLLVGKSTATV